MLLSFTLKGRENATPFLIILWESRTSIISSPVVWVYYHKLWLYNTKSEHTSSYILLMSTPPSTRVLTTFTLEY